MQVVALDQNNRFSFRGTCPHGKPHESAFLLVTSVHSDPIYQGAGFSSQYRLIAALQCQGCLNYILGIVVHPQNQMQYIYESHYPLGQPNDDVPQEVPELIRTDFKEALRCLWVDAYNATAEMCRRAVEASCIDFGAPAKLRVLEEKIDWLADQGKITPFMRDVAHKIRLGGNRGAHPTEKPPAATTSADQAQEQPFVITKEHAEAIVKFSREYFHHVYVVPKELEKYDFSRPKVSSSGEQKN